MSWDILNRFAADLEAAHTAEDAWAVTNRHAASLGFDKVLYLFFPEPDAPPVTMSSYDAAWMEYYADQGYDQNDLVVLETLKRQFRPLAFSVGAVLKLNDDLGRFERMLTEARFEGGCEHVYSHTLFHDGDGRGAMGFVTSDMTDAQFAQVVKENGPCLSAMIHMAHAELSTSMRESTRPPAPSLSGRQKDVLAHLAQGAHYKQIADRLGISDNTVAFHASELRRKFGCRTTRQVIQEAYRLQVLGSH